MEKLRRVRLEVRFAVGILVLFAAPLLAPPVTLTPVGNPVPGVGPVPVTVAETEQWAYALVADYQADRISSLRLDPATGLLTLMGTATTGDGPSALAASKDGRFVHCANLLSNDVSSLRLDPATGLLTLMGTASSGGSGPSGMALSDHGYLVVANRDSDDLAVLNLDPATGALTLVSTQPVGDGPSSVAVAGRKVIVGHAISNDVHYLNLDEFGDLHPIDTKSVGERVTSVAIRKPPGIVVAGTYPSGNVHAFVVRPGALVPLGSAPTGGDITDLEYSRRGQLLVTGITPPRLAAFDVTTGGLGVAGNLSLEGLSSRTLAIARGEGTTDYVIVNEYNNNRTIVIRAAP